MKKAIICYEISPFDNKENKWVIVCDEEKVDEQLKELEHHATDVYKTEVLNVYER